MSITYGADPELFLADAKGKPVVAVGKVGGTKDKPRMVGQYGLQEDNVMAEYTIPPSARAGHMLEYARQGASVVLDAVHAAGHPLNLYTRPTALFSLAALEAAGPQALQFGCSPDFDAYQMGAAHERVNPNVLLAGVVKGVDSAWRFAGGHIHLGYKDTYEVPEYVATMFADLTIGLALVIGGESQGERRKLYGVAGRFRPTSYGIEYRTPSNQWLYDGNTQDAVHFGCEAFARVMGADTVTQQRLYNEVPWNDLRTIIGTENRLDAENLSRWLNGSYHDLQLAYGG